MSYRFPTGTLCIDAFQFCVLFSLSLSKHIPKAKLMPEMSSVTSNYLGNMYHNSYFDKMLLSMGQTIFPIWPPIWPTAAIFKFLIQLVSLDFFLLPYGTSVPKGAFAS